MNPTELLTTTEALLAARDAAVAADKAKREAEAAFIKALDAAGIDFIETADGKRVAIENRPRRKFDIEVLAEHLGADILATILKEEVDPKALDAAVQSYLIDPMVADKATTVTYSTQVRVYGDKVVGERS
jgi:hypothetical protein